MHACMLAAMAGGRTEAFLWAMAAESSSTVSQAAAHSPALASSHCFLASAMAFSRLEMVSCASDCEGQQEGWCDRSCAPNLKCCL